MRDDVVSTAIGLVRALGAELDEARDRIEALEAAQAHATQALADLVRRLPPCREVHPAHGPCTSALGHEGPHRYPAPARPTLDRCVICEESALPLCVCPEVGGAKLCYGCLAAIRKAAP